MYTTFRKRFEAPRQSFQGHCTSGYVIFDSRLELAFQSLGEMFSPGTRLWLLFWLDRNSGLWRHFVRPPRARGGYRLGVFATRSPNRPTPIGLSLSEVIRFHSKELVLHVNGIDILDETPVLAIKKYNATDESFSELRSGWLDKRDSIQPLYYDGTENEMAECNYAVVFQEEALAQLAFINARSAIDIQGMIIRSLRRISLLSAVDCNDTAQSSRLAVGAFRVEYHFNCAEQQIQVARIVSGMSATVLDTEADTDPEARLHRDYSAQFGFAKSN